MGSNEVKRRGSNPQRDLFAQVYQGLPEGFRVFCIPNVSSTSNKNGISTLSSVKVGGMMTNCKCSPIEVCDECLLLEGNWGEEE